MRQSVVAAMSPVQRPASEAWGLQREDVLAGLGAGSRELGESFPLCALVPDSARHLASLAST